VFGESQNPVASAFAQWQVCCCFSATENVMSEVAVVAISVAKPGFEEQLREAMVGIVGPTRKEQGALQYDLHRDLKEPRRFVFFERWESEAALGAHAKSAHIAAYKEATAEWVEHFEIRVVTKIA
jgi:quinol monooxygenase YgiN